MVKQKRGNKKFKLYLVIFLSLIILFGGIFLIYQNYSEKITGEAVKKIVPRLANSNLACIDSDGGNFPYIKGGVKFNGIIYSDYGSYSGNGVEGGIYEYSCYNDQKYLNALFPCPLGIIDGDGACKKCRDTDGNNPFVAGVRSFIIINNDNSIQYSPDNCASQSVLHETYCSPSEDLPYGMDYDCPSLTGGFCELGKCVDRNGNPWVANVCGNGICEDESNYIENSVNCPRDCGALGRCDSSHSTFYSPLDTVCRDDWPTDIGPVIDIKSGDIPSCNLFEVCNPSIDYILKDATMCCSGNVPNPWIRGKLSACSFARANSNSNNKRCMGLYLIKSLGEEGVYMNNYFSPKWCCSSTTNQGCIDSETEESFFGECKSPGSDIPGVFTENAKKLVCEEPSDFFSAYHWESDTDMSKNSCKNYDWPAHVSLNIIKTGTCTDYSVALTTLLRKAGYMKNEVFTVMSDNHKWNAVKLPGDNKYTFADTTNGHKDNAIILNSLPGNYPYCNSIRKGYYNDNGHIGNKNYINLNQIYGCSQTEIGFIPDTKISKVKPYTLSVVNQSGVYVSKSYSVDASGLIRTNIEVTNKNNRTKIIKITEPIEGDFKINYLIKPNKEKVSYLGEEYGAGPKITDVSWEFNLASNKKQIISYTIQMPAGKNLLISPKTSVSFEGIDLKLNSKTIQIT